MAVKTANVVARVEPEIKEKAEAILEKLGLPVSVVINMLYRQIILHQGVPFTAALPPSIPAMDEMSREFDAMMAESLEQARSGKTVSLDEMTTRVQGILQRG